MTTQPPDQLAEIETSLGAVVLAVHIPESWGNIEAVEHMESDLGMYDWCIDDDDDKTSLLAAICYKMQDRLDVRRDNSLNTGNAVPFIHFEDQYFGGSLNQARKLQFTIDVYGGGDELFDTLVKVSDELKAMLLASYQSIPEANRNLARRGLTEQTTTKVTE